MRLTIGSFTLDGTAASSTVTSASLRLDMERPFVPIIRGNELRIDGLRAYIEAANEGALKTAMDTVRTNFNQANGKTVTFYNTTGTALFDVTAVEWPELEIEYDIDHSDVNAVVTFNVVARRTAPTTGGSADQTGQIGEIEWELEIGPNGLTGATATAEFGPSSGGSPTANANAATWVAKMLAGPPSDMPSFYSTRLRAVTAVPRFIQQPNQSSDTFNPVIVSVLFREVYAGLGTIPANITDLNCSADMVNSEAMDIRSGESDGPAIIVLSGWFTVKTEAPTGFLSAATKVDRGAIYSTALSVYNSIEADFRTVYARHALNEIGDPIINVGLDSGRVTFTRTFATTRVLQWKEKTTLTNVDPVVINRDYKGRDVVHRGNGGTVATLQHTFYGEGLDPIPYTPPALSGDWVRMDASQDVTIQAKLRGGVLVFTTIGSSNWRYANPTESGPVSPTTAGGKVFTMETIGNGAI